LIPVTPQPEPQGFDTSVRQRGNAFLAANPGAPKLPKYWKGAAADDLYAAYKGICAYTCMYFVAPGSVDHFFPKSQRRDLAYEWSNYRLALPLVNSYKGESTAVIDPFVVQDGWFVMDFPSCLVRAARDLSSAITEQIEKTVQVLRLNDADPFVQERCNVAVEFLDGHLSFDFLSRRYPFLAAEIRRQGGKDVLRAVFKR
jgi:hypothetical protein